MPGQQLIDAATNGTLDTVA